MAESDLDARNRKTLDRYTKDKKVGEGTYAVVYQGIQRDTNRPIAIKEIKTGLFKDGLDMSAIREVKYLQELRHENILELVDVFSTEHNLNLVLEFLPYDLEMLIKDDKVLFLPGHVKSWLLMTLRGVHHCHRNFILHRDLKPNNLLISTNGVLKLADFGLARSLSNPRENLTSNVVTRWYRAPELLFGARHYSPSVDIWSVGIIFAELMLRIPYLAGANDLDQIDVTFRAMGTPTEATWPGYKCLPGYKPDLVNIYPAPTIAELRHRFSAATDNTLDLLCLMTKMNPSERCDSEMALKHPYFTELPKPTRPEELPKKSVVATEEEKAIEKTRSKLMAAVLEKTRMKR